MLREQIEELRLSRQGFCSEAHLEQELKFCPDVAIAWTHGQYCTNEIPKLLVLKLIEKADNLEPGHHDY